METMASRDQLAIFTDGQLFQLFAAMLRWLAYFKDKDAHVADIYERHVRTVKLELTERGLIERDHYIM